MLKDSICEVLERKSDDSIIWMWNDYQDTIRGDDRIYPMYELNDFFCDTKVSDFLNAIDTGNFDLNDDYFYYSIWGVRTISDIYDVIDVDELADYIEDTQDDLSDSDIATLFDEEEE